MTDFPPRQPYTATLFTEFLMSKPGSLPRVSDERIAHITSDRTGFHAVTTTTEETLSAFDELRAWRKYKLSPDEKLLLRSITTDNPTLQALIDRLAPKPKD